MFCQMTNTAPQWKGRPTTPTCKILQSKSVTNLIYQQQRSLNGFYNNTENALDKTIVHSSDTVTVKCGLEVRTERSETLVELPTSSKNKLMNTMFQKKAGMNMEKSKQGNKEQN